MYFLHLAPLKKLLTYSVVIFCGCADINIREPEAPPKVEFRPVPNQGKLSGELPIICQDTQPQKGEKRAFFGFFYDSCKDPSGSVSVYVTSFDYLQRESPAEQYGMEIGDEIVAFNGCQVTTSADLTKKMKSFTATNAAVIGVRRRGKTEFMVIGTLRMDKRPSGIRKQCEGLGLRRSVD